MAEDCREKILSQDYWDFIIPNYRKDINIVFPENQVCIQDLGLGFRLISVDKKYVGELTVERYGYNVIPNCYALLDMSALNESGISALQNYPTLQLKGSGIMIGFIDTGIDYESAVFRNMDGSTRIAGIWDQTIQTGKLPEGFLYGSEYTEDMINEALRSADPRDIVPTVDTEGHGTFMASVAAGGSSPENQFVGAAPQSVIGMVKLKEAKTFLKDFYAIKPDALCFQENDVMQGLHYLHLLAEKRQMPLVLCVALGSTFGGHNGSTMLSHMLEDYSGTLDRCVVIGGGNEANQRHHYYGVLSSLDTTREVEVRVEKGSTGFVAELWTHLPNIMTAYLISPSGEKSPGISIRQGSRYTLTFPFDNTQVEVEYRLLTDNNDSQLIFFRFRNPAEGIWRIGVQPLHILDGIFHLWISMQEFLDGNVYFMESNPDYTVTDPGSTRGAMTVAYYNGQENSVDINSGRGYTRNRMIKPDYAVPGVQVTGTAGGDRFVSRSGSSVATGIAAGASALILEWLKGQPASRGATTSQVANIIILGTNQETLPEFPNKEWGYGTMDIYQSLDRLRRL